MRYCSVLSIIVCSLMLSFMPQHVFSHQDSHVGSYLNLYNGIKVRSPPNYLSRGHYIENNGGYLLFDATGDACHYAGAYPLGDLVTCLSKVMGHQLSANYSAPAFDTNSFFAFNEDIGFHIQTPAAAPKLQYSLQVSAFAFWIEDANGTIFWEPPCPVGQRSVSSALIRTQCVEDLAFNYSANAHTLKSAFTLKSPPAGLPNDVEWFIDNGASGFSSMLIQLRTRVRSVTAYGSTSVTGGGIQETRSTLNPNPYFFMTIFRTVLGDDLPLIGLHLRDDNLYLLGWMIGTDYYYFNDANVPAANLPGRRNIMLPFGGSYGALSRAGASRLNLAVGLTTIVQSASQLAAGNTVGIISRIGDANSIMYRVSYSSGESRNVALALLRLVQVVSEAARFFYLSDRIYANYDRGWQVDENAVVLENNWGVLSRNVLSGLALGSAALPAFEVNPGWSLRTLQEYANTVAAILFTAIAVIKHG